MNLRKREEEEDPKPDRVSRGGKGRIARPVVPLTDEERATAEANLGLCRMVALRFAAKHPGRDKMEFFQAAFDGLAPSVRTFDRSRSKLSTRAVPRMMGACLDMLRRDRLIACWWAAEGDRPAAFPFAPGDDLAGPDPAADVDSRDWVDRTLARLGAKERFVVFHYAVLEWNFTQIGDHLAITKSCACQIYGAAIEALRGHLTRESA